MAQVVYHGSRDGKPFDMSQSRFGGGLWCAKEAIYARDYTPHGQSWEHVYAVTVPDGLKVFRPDAAEQVAELEEYMAERYPWLGYTTDDLTADDLQGNTPYDRMEVQGCLDDLGYALVETHCEMLILDPETAGITVNRYVES